MSKDVRDSLIWCSVVFLAALTYCFLQQVSNHIPVTFSHVVQATIASMPMAIMGLAMPRMRQCGWQNTAARVTSLRTSAVFVFCLGFTQYLLVIDFWLRHQPSFLLMLGWLGAYVAAYGGLQFAVWRLSRPARNHGTGTVAQNSEPVVTPQAVESPQAKEPAIIRAGINR